MTQLLKPVSAAAFAVSNPAPPQLVTPLRLCSCFLATTVPLALLEPRTLFTWHPTLLTLGFFGLGVHGLLEARRARPTDGSERVSLLWSHAAWQSGSAAAVVAGAWAIYENKNRLGKPHLRTLHGRVGGAAIFFAIGAPLLGALAFRAIGLTARLPAVWQPRVKSTHRVVGASAWSLAVVATLLGLSHPAVDKGLLSRLWQLSALACAVLGAAVFHEPWGRALISSLRDLMGRGSSSSNSSSGNGGGGVRVGFSSSPNKGI